MELGQSESALTGALRHLEERGVRRTRARRMVLEALRTASGPLTAAELDRILRRRIPVSSLYRTLASLDEAGVLDRFVDATGVARFELAERLTGHHHHLTCVRCGATEDVDLEPDLEETLGRLASAAGASVSFDVVGHRLDLEGLCGRCR